MFFTLTDINAAWVTEAAEGEWAFIFIVKQLVVLFRDSSSFSVQSSGPLQHKQ